MYTSLRKCREAVAKLIRIRIGFLFGSEVSNFVAVRMGKSLRVFFLGVFALPVQLTVDSKHVFADFSSYDS